MDDPVDQVRAARRWLTSGLLLLLLWSAACGDRTVQATQDAKVTDGITYTCGKQDVIARLPGCRAAKTKSACAAAGGTWARGGWAGTEICFCPTGQAGCPCTTHDQCVRGCRGEVSGVSCDSAIFTCTPTTPEFGCYCERIPGFGVMKMCAD